MRRGVCHFLLVHAHDACTRRNHLSTSEDRKEEVRELSRKSAPALYTQVTPGLAKAGMERFFSMIPVDNLVHHIRETRALLLSRENNISSWLDFLPARAASFPASSDISPSIRKRREHTTTMATTMYNAGCRDPTVGEVCVF